MAKDYDVSGVLIGYVLSMDDVHYWHLDSAHLTRAVSRFQARLSCFFNARQDEDVSLFAEITRLYRWASQFIPTYPFRRPNGPTRFRGKLGELFQFTLSILNSESWVTEMNIGASEPECCCRAFYFKKNLITQITIQQKQNSEIC